MKYIFLIFMAVALHQPALLANEGANCEGLFTKLDEFSALKDGDTAWGVYTCKSCKTEKVTLKPGADGKQSCPNCGTPHTDETYKLDSVKKDAQGQNHIKKENEKDLVTDKNEKELADSGRKWTCGYCATSNFKTDPRCRSCGADHAEGKDLVLQSEKVPKSQYHNGIPGAPGGPPKVESKSKAVPIAIGAVAVTAAAGGTYWALSTNELEAKVASLKWQHTIYLERYSPVTKSGFKVDVSASTPVMPVNGSGERAGATNFRNCTSKYYKDGPKYACGTEFVDDVSYVTVPDGQDCQMEDQKNGSFKNVCRPKTKTITKVGKKPVTKYCSDPIYEQYCSYDTYQWAQAGSKSTSGREANGTLPWPQMSSGPLDRQRREESYEANLSYSYKDKSEAFKIDVASEQEFKTWKNSTKVKVFRRNAGGVSKWERIN